MVLTIMIMSGWRVSMMAILVVVVTIVFMLLIRIILVCMERRRMVVALVAGHFISSGLGCMPFITPIAAMCISMMSGWSVSGVLYVTTANNVVGHGHLTSARVHHFSRFFLPTSSDDNSILFIIVLVMVMSPSFVVVKKSV